MMSDVNDGGPAFPRPASKGNNYITGEMNIVIDPAEGMSLRDWFAGRVLAGIWSDFSRYQDMWKQEHGHYADDKDIACEAYRAADAMLEERQKREQ